MNGGLFELALIAVGIVLFLALVGLVVFAILRQQRVEMERARARQADLLRRAERAVPAMATILSTRTAVLGGQTAAMASATLRLQVVPPGGAPYTASAVWLVERSLVGSLQAGKEVPVKIDAEDAQIVYPNVRGARYVGKF